MALSLDYIGKYVIILVALAVAVGLIIQFSSEAANMLPELTPGNDDGGTEAELIEVTASSSEEEAQRLAELAGLCYDRYLDNPQQSFTCFIARKASGSFSEISADSILGKIEGEARSMTTVEDDPVGGQQTIVIEYQLTDNQIVIRN